MWVVVKIMVPFGVPIITRHLLFMVPKMGPKFFTTTHVEYGPFIAVGQPTLPALAVWAGGFCLRASGLWGLRLKALKLKQGFRLSASDAGLYCLRVSPCSVALGGRARREPQFLGLLARGEIV